MPEAVTVLPRVSVVINFLDRAPFLEEAIRSVLAQTFQQWELILVDDGSTDDGTAIAKDYAAGSEGRILYLEHEGHRNLGTSASRNLGMRRARGEYLAYLDGDDVWFPHKLDEQVSLLDRHADVGMVYGPPLMWGGWTGRPRDLAMDAIRPTGLPSGKILEPPELLELFLMNQRAVPSPSGILVRTSVMRSVGGSEESFRGMYDDQVLYAKLGLQTSVLVSDQCWYKYRRHDGQMVRMALRARESLAVRETFLRWLEAYLDEKGHRDTPAWTATQRALRPFNNRWLTLIEHLRYRAGVLKRRLRESLQRMWPTRPLLGTASRDES
jgi:glycosyltransferase involved in cell wall biosynthesis